VSPGFNTCRSELCELIPGAASAIINERLAVPDPKVLAAPRVTEKLPTAVGTPVIKPVLVFNVSPAGRPDALKLEAELVAEIWYENECPTEPVALVELVIEGFEATIVPVSVYCPMLP
jgi:hypothetical protein